MTIDEAIENEKRRAERCKGHYDRFVQMEAKEHEQIVEWLEELKMLRELKDEHRKIGNIEGFNQGYSKAENDYYAQSEKDIDDLIAKCENAKFAESDEIALSDIHTGVNSGLSMAIHFAEVIKALFR